MISTEVTLTVPEGDWAAVSLVAGTTSVSAAPVDGPEVTLRHSGERGLQIVWVSRAGEVRRVPLTGESTPVGNAEIAALGPVQSFVTLR